MEADVDVVDFQGISSTDKKVREIRNQLTVNPDLNFSVITAHGIEMGHHLNAVPPVALGEKVRQRLEVWVLSRIGQPIALVA
jgi:hypothetical protein